MILTRTTTPTPKWYYFSLLVFSLFLFQTSDARLHRPPQHLGANHHDITNNRKLEIEEYPIELEPFHLVYHHHPRRNSSFNGMEEMDVLAATRNYLNTVLHNHHGTNFQRLLLYLFIRQEDDYLTKVAYSGTVLLSSPTTPLMRQSVQDLLWKSFLGTNKTDYLLELKRYSVFDIDSVTLMDITGNLIGIDSETGTISIATATTTNQGTPTTINGNNNNNANESTPPYDTSMSSNVSMSLYLAAIIVPITVLVLLLSFLVVRKLRYDVLWRPPNENDPNGTHWQTAQKLEQQHSSFVPPEGITIVTPQTMTDPSESTMQVFPAFMDDSKVMIPQKEEQQEHSNHHPFSSNDNNDDAEYDNKPIANHNVNTKKETEEHRKSTTSLGTLLQKKKKKKKQSAKDAATEAGIQGTPLKEKNANSTDPGKKKKQIPPKNAVTSEVQGSGSSGTDNATPLKKKLSKSKGLASAIRKGDNDTTAATTATTLVKKKKTKSTKAAKAVVSEVQLLENEDTNNDKTSLKKKLSMAKSFLSEAQRGGDDDTAAATTATTLLVKKKENLSKEKVAGGSSLANNTDTIPTTTTTTTTDKTLVPKSKQLNKETQRRASYTSAATKNSQLGMTKRPSSGGTKTKEKLRRSNDTICKISNEAETEKTKRKSSIIKGNNSQLQVVVEGTHPDLTPTKRKTKKNAIKTIGGSISEPATITDNNHCSLSTYLDNS